MLNCEFIGMNGVFKYASHLGFNNPYVVKHNGEFVFNSTFKSILSTTKSPNTINPKAVLSFLNHYYFLGDDCLVNEIERTPWMGMPDNNGTGWDFYELPKHQHLLKAEEDVADELFELICDEITSYVGRAKSVGILLSGGMDSRIVAGCLYHLICQKDIDVNRVVAYNWGNTNSRDHIYAKQITENLGWEFKSFQVGPKELWENFMISGIRGCEYSGLHLHAMPQIAEANDVEVILAGSYGDSIGRAEYSGVKVDQLKPIGNHLTNRTGLLSPTVFRKAKAEVLKDLDKYHHRFKTNEKYQEYEVDKQLHYMRRMLNPCMEVIHERTPLFQIFTRPKVFGYMWSLDVGVRNDKVYYHLLQKFSYKISEIPWARTGKRYMHEEDTPDLYMKRHHTYTDIVQFDLFDKILDYVVAAKDHLPYVNIEAFKILMQEIKRYPKYNFDYLEIICWMVSYTKFISTYQDKLSLSNVYHSKVLAQKAKFIYRILTRVRYAKSKLG